MTGYWMIRAQVMGLMIQLQTVVAWAVAHIEGANDWNDPITRFFIAWMASFCQLATKTLQIVNDPTTVAPLLGKRCMFY